jgi:hypothetical protein
MEVHALDGTLAMVAAARWPGAADQRLPVQGDVLHEAVAGRPAPSPGWCRWLATLAACSVAYSLRFVHDVFFNGPPATCPTPPARAALGMKAPVACCWCAMCMAVGLLPMLTFGPLVHVAATAVLGGAAGLPPGALARLQPAAADERHGPGRRRGAVLCAAARFGCTCTIRGVGTGRLIFSG